MKKILIYGANGYTGKLLTEYLLQRDVQPVLAGRSNSVVQVAKNFGCESRTFSTDDAPSFLEDIYILINLAGPFKYTQKALIKACLHSNTHYLDIAGEYPEMKTAYQFDDEAKEVGISIVPGAGFGVVPTDIAAKLASQGVEDPSNLRIAYATEGGASQGTLYTVLKDINQPGIILKDGKSKEALPAQSKLDFQVAKKQFSAVYNPWRADLVTAQYSTGIKNIETYSVFPGFVVSMMKGKMLWLRNLMVSKIISWMPEGPSKKQLRKGRTFIEAVASNESGERKVVSVVGPEAYVFTVACLYQLSMAITNDSALHGAIPPSAFGQETLSDIDGVEIIIH